MGLSTGTLFLKEFLFLETNERKHFLCRNNFNKIKAYKKPSEQMLDEQKTKEQLLPHWTMHIYIYNCSSYMLILSILLLPQMQVLNVSEKPVAKKGLTYLLLT